MLLFSSLFPLSLYAQELKTKDLDLFDLSLEQLLNIDVSLGTRKEGRELGRSPTPVDIITSQQIERTGFDNLTQILQRHVPYFNLPRIALADGAEHVRPFTLRGMRAEQALILINGKRYHTSASLNFFFFSVGSSPDINTIPVSSIDRIEILRDGAAAQYGSDAIAGVINIVLKNEVTSRISALGGSSDETDGDIYKTAIEHGFTFADNSFIQLTAEYREWTGVNRAGPDDRQRYFTGDPRNNEPEQVRNYLGDAIYDDIALSLNSEFYLLHGTVFNTATFNRRDTLTNAFPRTPQDDRVVRGLFPDGMTPTFETDITDFTWTTGYKIDPINDQWDLELSNSMGYNAYDITISNSNNASLGLSSPTSVDAGKLSLFQNSINFDAVKEFTVEQLTNPLSFAVGMELRHENFEIDDGESASYTNGGALVLDGPNTGAVTQPGIQSYAGFNPDNAVEENRQSLSVYIDLENDINDELLIQNAWRYEYFTDFGSTFNGKLAANYRVNDQVSMRGSLSTGFRAPSLSQSYFSRTSTNFNLNTLVFQESGFYKVDDPIAQAVGAEDLDAETSKHISAGIVFTPLKDLKIEFDAFYLQVDDGVVLSAEIAADPNVIPLSVVQQLNAADVELVQYMTNALNSESYGFDLNTYYDLNFKQYGALKLSALYHQNKQIVRSINTPDILGDQGEALIFGELLQESFRYDNPKNTLILTGNYQLDHHHLLVRAWRSGITRASNHPIDKDIENGPHWVIDMEYENRITENVTIALGGNNIFDQKPAKGSPFAGFFGNGNVLEYTTTPIGVDQDIYYVRISIDL